MLLITKIPFNTTKRQSVADPSKASDSSISLIKIHGRGHSQVLRHTQNEGDFPVRGEWPWSSGAKDPSFFAMSVGRDASTIKLSRVGFKSQRDGDGINVLPR